jgi:ferredoxin-type protein NapG
MNSAAITSLFFGYGGWMSSRTERSPTRKLLLKPPGALPDHEFQSRCIRCLRCVDACPNHAIMTLAYSWGGSPKGTPAIKPRRQACMLCNKTGGHYLKCTEACPTGALRLISKRPDEILQKVSMGVAEIDRSLCYSYNNYICGSCYRSCPFPGKAMTLGLWEKPIVHAESCVGCGLCERSCIMYPQAIRVRATVA